MTGDRFVAWSHMPIEVRLPHKLGDRGAIFFDEYISKRWLSCP